MSEIANTTKIHLGVGPRNLWDVWPTTSHQGLAKIPFWHISL
jgi:hypothetical protein